MWPLAEAVLLFLQKTFQFVPVWHELCLVWWWTLVDSRPKYSVCSLLLGPQSDTWNYGKWSVSLIRWWKHRHYILGAWLCWHSHLIPLKHSFLILFTLSSLFFNFHIQFPPLFRTAGPFFQYTHKNRKVALQIREYYTPREWEKYFREINRKHEWDWTAELHLNELSGVSFFQLWGISWSTMSPNHRQRVMTPGSSANLIVEKRSHPVFMEEGRPYFFPEFSAGGKTSEGYRGETFGFAPSVAWCDILEDTSIIFSKWYRLNNNTPNITINNIALWLNNLWQVNDLNGSDAGLKLN